MSDQQLSRRRALGVAGGIVAGLTAAALTGCTTGSSRAPRERADCVVRGDLSRRSRLAELPLVYEVSGNRNAFWFDAGFAARLETWLADLRAVGLRPARLWTYGAWTDGRGGGPGGGTDGAGTCTSWHNSGRAFDLARIERADGSFVSFRYDQWRRNSGASLRRARGEYWSVAASLHRRFAYVVSYPYNEAHHNHIHIDNARSGGQDATFTPSSPTQLQAVQAISTHVFERAVPVTGRFDAATRRATEDQLRELGGPRSLTEVGGWDRYLSAAAARLGD